MYIMDTDTAIICSADFWRCCCIWGYFEVQLIGNLGQCANIELSAVRIYSFFLIVTAWTLNSVQKRVRRFRHAKLRLFVTLNAPHWGTFARLEMAQQSLQ